jgi:hypothetical protein
MNELKRYPHEILHNWNEFTTFAVTATQNTITKLQSHETVDYIQSENSFHSTVYQDNAPWSLSVNLIPFFHVIAN